MGKTTETKRQTTSCPDEEGSRYQNFPVDFVRRTLEILKVYKGRHEETLLLNCLLGLLVTPHEISEFLKEIPNFGEGKLKALGVPVDLIEWGNTRRGNPRRKNLHTFIRCLRGSVRYLLVKPIRDNGQIKGFHFMWEGGFDAPVECGEIRQVISELFTHLDRAFKIERSEYAEDIEAIERSQNEPTVSLEQVLRETEKID